MNLLTNMLMLIIVAIVMLSFLEQHNTYKESFTGMFDGVKHHFYKHKRNLRHMIKNKQKRRSDKNHENYNKKPFLLQLLGTIGLGNII